jgi:spectrin alpha
MRARVARLLRSKVVEEKRKQLRQRLEGCRQRTLAYTSTLNKIRESYGDAIRTWNLDVEYGHDLPSVKRLQRKHDGFERDLDALGDRIRELDDISQRLINTHPDQAQSIYQKQFKIQNAWTDLIQKADVRKARLLDEFDYQNFIAHFRDLASWTNSMIVQVSSDELAKDVPGAEALLERNHEHCMQIDARGETLQDFKDFGTQLIQNGNYESDNIRAKLEEMQGLRNDLERAWKTRQEKLDQCLELQLFNRNCESAEQWMKSREHALTEDNKDCGADGDRVGRYCQR